MDAMYGCCVCVYGWLYIVVCDFDAVCIGYELCVFGRSLYVYSKEYMLKIVDEKIPS